MVCDRGTRGGGGARCAMPGREVLQPSAAASRGSWLHSRSKANMLGIFLADGTRSAMFVGQVHREDSVMGRWFLSQVLIGFGHIIWHTRQGAPGLCCGFLSQHLVACCLASCWLQAIHSSARRIMRHDSTTKVLAKRLKYYMISW